MAAVGGSWLVPGREKRRSSCHDVQHLAVCSRSTQYIHLCRSLITSLATQMGATVVGEMDQETVFLWSTHHLQSECGMLRLSKRVLPFLALENPYQWGSVARNKLLSLTNFICISFSLRFFCAFIPLIWPCCTCAGGWWSLALQSLVLQCLCDLGCDDVHCKHTQPVCHQHWQVGG